MRKIFTLMLTATFVAGVFAQKPEAVFLKASTNASLENSISKCND
jgi:hypothetical protein